MKAIMVMFDSLCRRMLTPYGATDVQTPGFQRLAEHSLRFDQSWIGSMPCMPARRDLHTGRYNFLHRAWGPLEPFDDSMPEILKSNGVYSHLITDHYHYWQDGGATYHNRYSSAEFVRGQEVDECKAAIFAPEFPDNYDPSLSGWRKELDKRDFVNRSYMDSEEKMCTPQVFALAEEFLEKHHSADNWFLHVEAFDPHEPYFSSPECQALYPEEYNGPHFDWPFYRQVEESPEMVEHCKNRARAVFSLCDKYLNRLLDMMDKHNLWEDTMLIVNTDHGFMFGEHGWWAKNLPPSYCEVAHTPLFIWDPRSQHKNESRQGLASMIDMAPTLLKYFNLEPTVDMDGKDLQPVIENDTPVHQSLIFGYFGKEVNITDGRYVYMHGGPNGQPVYEYTLMPCYMNYRMSPELLATATFVPQTQSFPFAKGCPLLKIPQKSQGLEETLLFDLNEDYQQNHPLDAPDIASRLAGEIKCWMVKNQAPEEQFMRLNLG